MTFEERIRKAILDTQNECNYKPTAFIHMVETDGAEATVKRMLASEHKMPDGLIKLWELKRLDLCFEYIIFEPEWHDMFTKAELTEARNRLKKLGMDVSKLSVEPLDKKKDDLESPIFHLTKEEFKNAIDECGIHDSEKKLFQFFFETSDYTMSTQELAEKFGYADLGPVNSLIGKFAHRIADFYKVSLERESNSPGWWRVIATGEYREKIFFWTLKKEFVEALNESVSFSKMTTHWIAPANADIYDVEKAYLKYHTIDWHQTNKNVSVGDIVYIYKTLPDQIIRFKCIVLDVNKKRGDEKDLDCYVDINTFENFGCFMTLQFLTRFENNYPTMQGLKDAGINVVRGLMECPAEAFEYINNCEAEDSSIKRFDGSIPSDLPKNHWTITGSDEEELKKQAEIDAKGLSDEALFEKARQQGTTKPKGHITMTSTYDRNPNVAEASKRRAKGICQLCDEPAPFTDKYGKPYLESHHIIWLSEGGEDTLENTAALCPNCHRKMHVVNDPKDVNKLLEKSKISISY